MEVKYEINKLIWDDFGRPSGVLLLDKPANISAHDLVDIVRKKLKTTKVGHAGALDTVSTGLMLILVGKATRLSESYMGMDKTYKAQLILGVSTETQDIEGAVTKSLPTGGLDEEKVKETIKSFKGGYNQFVSPFSSVKVAGRKLRKVLRDKRYSYKIINDADRSHRYIELFNKESGSLVERLEVPQRFLNLDSVVIDNISKVKSDTLPYPSDKVAEGIYTVVGFTIKCSKGTYIRQLAEDIGYKLNLPASLLGLRRTAIDKFDESMVVDLESIN